MRPDSSETCRSILLVCGWMFYAAAVVVMLMTVMQSRLITSLLDGVALIFVGVVSGTFTHAAAHVLAWLAEIGGLLKKCEAELYELRRRAEQGRAQ